MKKIQVIIIVLFCITGNAYSQTIQEADKRLSESLSQIAYWRDNQDKDVSGGDSLSGANDNLYSYLIAISVKLPIDGRFPMVEQNGLNITIAPDNKIKIFSWDSWTGGTMHRYYSLAAYQTNKGIETSDVVDLSDSAHDRSTISYKDYSEGGYSFNEIIPVKDKKNTITYILFGNSRESTHEWGELVMALRIVNDALVNVPFFKTTTKTLKFISYYYDVRYSHYKGGHPTMHLSKDNKKLFIPIVSGPNGEDITNKYLVYVFDGNNYVFDKNAK